MVEAASSRVIGEFPPAASARSRAAKVRDAGPQASMQEVAMRVMRLRLLARCLVSQA